MITPDMMVPSRPIVLKYKYDREYSSATAGRSSIVDVVSSGNIVVAISVVVSDALRGSSQ